MTIGFCNVQGISFVFIYLIVFSLLALSRGISARAKTIKAYGFRHQKIKDSWTVCICVLLFCFQEKRNE